MTAATSTKKASFFRTRYKNDFSQNKKMFIIHIVMELLGLPVYAVIGLVAAYYNNLENIPNSTLYAIESGCAAFAFIATLAVIICLFLGMTIALNHFNYLYKKSIADMNYGLPLNSKQRFFADYLSGFVMYLVPFLGAVLLAIAILGIGTPIIPNMNEFWEMFPQILKCLSIVIIAMMLFYTLAVFSIIFCGNTFEAIFSVLAFNVLIPATVACVWVALCNSYSYGIDEAAIFYKNIFTSTSPVGAVCFFFTFASELGVFESSSFSTFLLIKWICITLAVIAVYLFAAYFLYKHRKAEDVSKPYVYKTAFYAMMTMSVYCVLSLFITFNGFLAAGIVLCGIVWFIMEVITRRGFKKFWQAGLGFGAAVLSVILICNVFEVSKGFGMAKSVPSASSVESVAIESYRFFDTKFVFRDRNVIEETVKLHEELVDRHFNSENYEYKTIQKDNYYSNLCDDTLYINYSTFTGSTSTRSYETPTGMSGELLKAILLSDDYAEQIYKGFSDYEFNFYKNNPYYELTLRFENKSCESNTKTVSISELKAVREAYYKDLLAMTEDDLLNGKYCGLIDGSYFVLENFDNTIALLEEIGFSCDDITKDDIIDEIGYTKYPEFYSYAKQVFETDYSQKDNSYYYYEIDSSNEYTVVDSISTVGYHYGHSARYTLVPTDTAVELINRCTTVVLGEKPIAVFEVNGRQLSLLDRGDNKELLENLGKPIEQFSFTVGTDENGWDSYD